MARETIALYRHLEYLQEMGCDCVYIHAHKIFIIIAAAFFQLYTR